MIEKKRENKQEVERCHQKTLSLWYNSIEVYYRSCVIIVQSSCKIMVNSKSKSTREHIINKALVASKCRFVSIQTFIYNETTAYLNLFPKIFHSNNYFSSPAEFFIYPITDYFSLLI